MGSYLKGICDMKYIKAEIEIITLENLDIVTLSAITSVEQAADIACGAEIGVNGWHNKNCQTINSSHYEKIKQKLREMGYDI